MLAELDEPHSVSERTPSIGRHAHREPGLADPTNTCDGHQAERSK
jgi:hypothetical protein